MRHKSTTKNLQQILSAWGELSFSVLVGSRATGTERDDSDWDIALYWREDIPWLERVEQTETLRRELAKGLGENESRIDLIDLANANLAMRVAVAEEGLPLIGEESVAWARFLRRTWRELEDFYWEKEHAA
jgi:predicted nucleotidyltransferase